VISFTVFSDAASRRHDRHTDVIRCFTVPVNLVYRLRRIMGFSDESKILIKKTCMIQKGTGGTAPKKLIKEFPEKRLEQKWTVVQRRVYQRLKTNP